MKTVKNLFRLQGFKVFADILNTIDQAGGELNKLTSNLRAVYSRDILFKAMPVMRFYQFATIKTELGVEPGLTINMLSYDNITRGGALVEGTRMTPRALSSSLVPITVGERGNAVVVSQLLIVASFDDVMASTTTLLARDMAIVMDCELRDTCLSCSHVVYARKSDGTPATAGRTNILSTNVLSVAAIKDAVEILATANAPKIEGNFYICFVHPHQSRSLRDDVAWIEASKYGAPDQLFTGEIGRIDDVRFIETTLMCNGAVAASDPAYKADLVSGTAGNVANIYQAILFGAEYFGLAVSLPVELRDNGVVDYGRERGLAWYSIYGSGLIHADYGVRIETA